MKIPPDDLIERLRRATGDADTAQLMEAAANRLEEQDIECATLRHGLRLANRRADEAADRLRQEEIMGQVLRAAKGERHKVPCTSRADTICPQPAYCHANGCKRAEGERKPAYGCHADLEPGMEPDTCLIDEGDRTGCRHARAGGEKTTCSYWQPIATPK